MVHIAPLVAAPVADVRRVGPLLDAVHGIPSLARLAVARGKQGGVVEGRVLVRWESGVDAVARAVGAGGGPSGGLPAKVVPCRDAAQYKVLKEKKTKKKTCSQTMQ